MKFPATTHKMLAATLLLSWVTGLRAQSDPAPLAVEERTSDTVVARAAWGDVKLIEILEYYTHYLYPTRTLPFGPVVPPKEAAGMPVEWLDKLARSYVIAKASEKAADFEADQEVKDEFQRKLNSWLLNYALPEAKKELVAGVVADPTEEEIARYYERQKARYFHPFEFTMRHIFLSTYEPYVLGKNETLEGVAQRLLGDKRRVGEILSDSPGRPERWVPPEKRREKFFKPEYEGEPLLVPMSPEKIEKVRQKMEEIRARVLRGEDFVALAREFSEAEVKGGLIGPLPSGVSPERWMQTSILEAAAKTPVGEISPVLPTKYGYHLLKIEEKKDERLQPLDEVRGEIRAAIRKEREEQVERDAIRELVKRPELELVMEAFQKAPNVEDNEVFVRIGLHSFDWKDLKPVWEKQIGPGATREQILNGLRVHPSIIGALTLEWAKERKIWERPDLAEKYKNMRTGVFGATVNKREIEAAVREALTEDAITRYYNERKDSYFMPLMGVYHILARRVDPARKGDPMELERMRSELDREIASIQNINQFIQLAKKTNPPPPEGGHWNVLAPSLLDKVGGPTGEQLRQLRSGQWSRAYIEGDTVRSVAMIERSDARHKSPTEVRGEIAKAIRERVEAETRGKLEQIWLDKAKYQFLLSSSPPDQAKKSDGP